MTHETESLEDVARRYLEVRLQLDELERIHKQRAGAIAELERYLKTAADAFLDVEELEAVEPVAALVVDVGGGRALVVYVQADGALRIDVAPARRVSIEPLDVQALEAEALGKDGRP